MIQQPIFITRDNEAELEGFLGWVVRQCRLDSYSTNLLTRRAVFSMQAIAVLLAVNFFFDLGAWWLLFNAVFSGGQGVFELGAHSLAALFASLLISIVIFIYEQQFMTTDTSAIGRSARVSPFDVRRSSNWCTTSWHAPSRTCFGRACRRLIPCLSRLQPSRRSVGGFAFRMS